MNGNKESNALNLPKIEVTRELHTIRARLFHYATLLEDFCLSVKFVRDTPNPAMESDLKRGTSRDLLRKECEHLLIQIRRLSVSREFWDQRLQNIMVLVDTMRMGLSRTTLGPSYRSCLKPCGL